MSKYKMIAFDMDGTLLNSQKKVRKETLDAINKAFDGGKEVILCTGRALAELEEYIELIPRMRYMVMTSGAFVYDIKEKKDIYANEICYQMHLNPYTKANVLSKKRVKELVDVACEILNKAILQGGTTIHSFSANGIDGLFQVQLKVHMQKHCPLGHEIKKVMINERGTYYCPICQKAKR